MKMKRLNHLKEIESYRQGVLRNLKLDLPQDYLDRSRIFGMVDGNGELRGAFLYCLRPPFRSIEGIPAAERERIKKRVDLDRCVEGNGMWLDKSVTDPVDCARYWGAVLLEMLRTGKTEWVCSWTPKAGALDEVHGVSNPEHLYVGPCMLPGMQQEGIEVVVHGSIWSQARRLISDPRWLMRRSLGRRYRSLRREAMAQ